MSVAFTIWDPPLKQLCLTRPKFYDQLATQLVRSLHELTAETLFANGLDDDDDDDDNVENQATVQWLRHLLYSDSWVRVRAILQPRGRPLHSGNLAGALVEECILNPLPATLRFAECVLEHADDEFRGFYGQYYRAARGPRWRRRRRGRGGDGEEAPGELGEVRTGGQRKRSLVVADADEDEEGRVEAENRSGDGAQPRKVGRIQTAGWARAPIGELPVRRSIPMSNVDDI
jgi:hypothetical protein